MKSVTSIAPDDTFLQLKKASEKAGISPTELLRKVKAGTFPTPYHVTPFCVRWSAREINEWIADIKAREKKAS